MAKQESKSGSKAKESPRGGTKQPSVRRTIRKYTVTEKSQRRRKRKQILGEVSAYEQEFHFRGHSLEELRTMTLEQEIELMTANVRRAYRRGWNQTQQRFYDRLLLRTEQGKAIRTHLRDFPILTRMVGLTIQIHNGRGFQKIHITEEMLGHLLGEFAQTRKVPVHVRKGIGASKSSAHVAMK